MKKLSLVLLALLVGLPLFAGDLDNAVFSIAGSSSLIWGVDLMSMATGFDNVNDAKLRIDFKPAATAMHNGKEAGEIYGEIAFKDIYLKTKEINGVEDLDADLEMRIKFDYAKIMAPTWWVQVSGPTNEIDYENALQNGIIGIAAAWDGQMDNVKNAVTSVGGFKAGFKVPDVVSLEASLFSMTDWTATEDTEGYNAYGATVKAAVLAVPNLTFEVMANMGFGAEETDTTVNDDIGFGALVNYKIALDETMYIKPEIGVDARLVEDGMNLAIGNGLTFGLPGSEITAAEDVVKDDTGAIFAWDDGVDAGLKVGWSYYMPADTTIDPSLGLQAHLGLSMIENLQVAAGFEAANLMDPDAKMGMALWGKYTMGMIAPYVGLFMGFETDTVDPKMIAEAGLAITNFLPLTSFYIDWNSGDLALDEADLGILKLKVKIAY